MTAPVLATRRLRLRRPVPGDMAGYARFARSQRARHTDFCKTEAAAWRLFCVELAHWDLRGFGMFALTTPQDDTCIGLVGHWYPEGWPEREIGWLLWPEAEGKGYGHEAARACIDHAFGALGWDSAVSYIADDNHRSIALAERLGASHDTAAVTLDADCRVYRHPQPMAQS